MGTKPDAASGGSSQAELRESQEAQARLCEIPGDEA